MALLGAMLVPACTNGGPAPPAEAVTAVQEPSASASESASAPASATAEATVKAIPHELADDIDPELRNELLAMMAEDQAVRTGVAPPGDDRTAEELLGQMTAVDEANSRRMREILDEHGWPGRSLVGDDGSVAAWVIVQHADLQLDLQELGLRYLQGAVDAGDASPGDLAYLVDRVRVAKGLPQVYGTQLVPGPDGEILIEDEANVDARRAAVGLGTLAEYYEEFRRAMEESED